MIFGNLDDDFFFFFEKMMIVVFFLKMNEAWANPPSLEHEFMSLEKNFIWLIFENNYASDDFLKTNKLGMPECPNLIKKKKKFLVFISPKQNA